MSNFFSYSIRVALRAMVISLVITVTLGARLAAAQPAADAREPDPKPGFGMLVAGGIMLAANVGLLGGGVGLLVHSRAEEARCSMPGQDCSWQFHSLTASIGIGVTAFGGVMALVGIGLLGSGAHARLHKPEHRYHALRLTPFIARSGTGLAGEIRF